MTRSAQPMLARLLRPYPAAASASTPLAGEYVPVKLSELPAAARRFSSCAAAPTAIALQGCLGLSGRCSCWRCTTLSPLPASLAVRACTTATGNHPLFELEKIKKSSKGIVDEGEPGPDDTPHITAPMPEMVEEGFRDIQEEATARPGSPTLPDFFAAEARATREPSDPDRPQHEYGQRVTPRASDPTADTNREGDYGGPGQDYSGGATPVVTDPVSGLASGTVIGKPGSAGRAEGAGAAEVRGRGEQAQGVNTQSTGGPFAMFGDIVQGEDKEKEKKGK